MEGSYKVVETRQDLESGDLAQIPIWTLISVINLSP
jgi:hypothetical protein